MRQGRFYEWMNKPVTGEILSSSLLHSLSELQSETDDSQDQQHRRRNNIVFQGHCPTQSDPVLVRSAQLSPKGHYTQDILPSTINSDEISLKVCKLPLLHFNERINSMTVFCLIVTLISEK